MTRSENLTKIKALLQKKMISTKHFSELGSFLLSRGLSQQIVDEILGELKIKCQDLDMKQWLLCLQDILSSKIKTSGGVHFSEKSPKLIAFVGPTGVGKTTTLLKLASHVSQVQKKSVGLITLDQQKAGAYAQLEKYAKRWDVPLYTQKEHIALIPYVDLILIDTAGCNYYEPERVEQIGAQLNAIVGVEIHLTLSAATKDVDLYGAIHQFSSLKLTSLIFTKLDETLAAGVLINVSSRVDIPISYIAYGYPLPGKIEVADSQAIIHKILTDLNGENFHFLRQLVCQNKP